MSVYFSGIRLVDEFSEVLASGNEKIDVRVFEKWVDTDISSVAHCGDPGSCEVSRAEGFSNKAIINMKGVLESELGVKGLASLKSRIESQIGHELQWTKTETITKRFEHSSPKCGKKLITIYELWRDFEITYYRRRKLTLKRDVWEEKWRRVLPYQTNKHDALPNIEPYEELCGCSEKKEQAFDARACFDFGSVSFRVPYRVVNNNIEIQVFDHIVVLEFDNIESPVRGLMNGMDMEVPTNLIPEVIKFLGEINESKTRARVIKFVDVGADEKPLKVMREFAEFTGAIQTIKGRFFEG